MHSEPQLRLSLADDAFLCSCRDHYVFLNLKTDKYLCVARERLERLKQVSILAPSIVSPAVNIAAQDAVTSSNPREHSLAHNLIRAGLLKSVPPGTPSSELAPTSITPPTRQLSRNCREWGGPPAWTYSLSFLRSAAVAHIALSYRSIRATARDAARKKSQARRQTPFDIAHTTRLVVAFNSLRPFFPRDYLCLFDSLSLYNFLLRHGVASQWVFGVEADPFCAHCWLQLDDMVLNDKIAYVSRFTPIMTI
jgi:hypothetical protein